MTFTRTIPSGVCGGNDIYGAQQHLPLYDALVPWDEAGSRCRDQPGVLLADRRRA